MLVVALDTTTRPGSLAIVRDGEVLLASAGRGDRPHAERLPGEIVQALDGLGFRLPDVDVFGVAVGPGSFTGLRIGLASIQGLAYGAGRPVVGVSAFDALALAVYGARPDLRSVPLGMWLDAQRQEVFAAVVSVDGAGTDLTRQLRIIAEPSVGLPPAVIDAWAREPWFASLTFAGEGARAYRAVIDGARAGAAPILDHTPDLAPAIGLIAEARARDGGGTAPHALKPLYVRRPDAELARDRRLASAT